MISERAALVALAAITVSEPANAAVTISTAATQNMTCSGGVCAPTATKAVLNVNDLETLLASGNVTVTTTGAGVQAEHIRVEAALSWSSTSALALDAYHSIAFANSVSITGLSDLSLTINDGGRGGTLSFGRTGSVSFQNLASQLTINGAAYTLVSSIATLASAIVANPAGDYALASNYDASGDGTYSAPPIGTMFTGALEGLGNRISNLAINAGTREAGLFKEIGQGGRVENLGLLKANVTSRPAVNERPAGILAATNLGKIDQSYATGKASGSGHSDLGGLVGLNRGTINSSHTDVRMSGGLYSGGLVGYNWGPIDLSYAEGPVASKNVNALAQGGLVGRDIGATISRSYATGAVSSSVVAGGLAGESDDGNIVQCHATGSVSSSFVAGGLIGQTDSGADVAMQSYATGTVIGDQYSGGLVGWSSGTVAQSFSTGSVAGNSEVGGLTGVNWTAISDSYATGSVSGQQSTEDGGLSGHNEGTVAQVYSTGAPSGGAGSYVGGLLGYDVPRKHSNTAAYWDTDTSGITNLSQGAGNITNDKGITGLTTQQFQSGLPAGFDPNIWAEDSGINHGFPYLITNPPPM
jgi:hypothetical protein